MKAETKANLDDEIFYLDGGDVCSAPVISIKIVINQSNADRYADGTSSCELYCAFGDEGVWYKTIHGVYHESQIFLSREDLGKAVAEGTLNKKTT